MIGGVYVLDVLQAKMTPEQYEGFLLGNIIKYSLRYNWRGERASDMRKCTHYCELLLAWRERKDAATRLIEKEENKRAKR